MPWSAMTKGIKAILVMPDTMSSERRNLLRAYGAELVLTPGAEGMKGAIKKAEELAEEHGYFMPQQFNNPANAEVHRRTTGKEIAEQFGDGLDAFIAGIGTGGTITGAGEVLKEKIRPSRFSRWNRLILLFFPEENQGRTKFRESERDSFRKS